MFCSARFSPKIWFLLGAFCLAAFPASGLWASEKALEILENNGLSADADSLRGYLESLQPDSETTKHIQKLVRQLGDEDFFQREAAIQELVRTPIHTPGLLQNAIEGDDPEIAWRAKQVQKLSGGQTERLLYAVFSVIETRRIPGLAEAIIEAFPHCEDDFLKSRAAKALAETATAADTGLLSETALAAKTESPPETALRIAAISALEAVSGKGADDTLAQLLGRSQPDEIRLSASRAMANHGSRRSLATLVGLLESEDVLVRTKAVRVLRAVTGQQYEFQAHEDPVDRSIKVLAWKRWLEEDSPAAKLNFPLDEVTINFGRTLLANYSRRKVYELDAAGKVVWEQDVSGVWTVRGLENGHRLVASYTGKFLVEYDNAGKEVWRFDDLPNKPYSIQRLPNGNTLVPVYGNEILEIRPDKTFARRIRLPETVKWAEQLENGRILVVFYNSGRIAELDNEGEVLWQVAGMGQPYSVERLGNGNTLVANRRNNQVVEVDRDGKIVWSFGAKPSLYRAQRLRNGNTLIVTSAGAVEIDPAGETVWSRDESGLRGIDRY